MESLRTYNPYYINELGKKTKAFSYFSKAIKNGLMSYTLKQTRQPRILEFNEKVFQFEDIFDTIQENFEEKMINAKYCYMLDLMRAYCNEDGRYGKHVFARRLREHGFSKKDIWRYFKILKSFKYLFFKGDGA